jgi:hypothetical protein
MDNELNEAINFDLSSDILGNLKIADLGFERSDLLGDFRQARHPLVDSIYDKIDLNSWDNIDLDDTRELTAIYLMTAKIIAKTELTAFANDSALNDRLKLIFGDSYNTELAERIFEKFSQEDFSSLPKIETVDAEAIAGANGAFADATNSIYLSNQFIEANFTHPEIIAEVLLEEVGHYLDSQINREDTPGDEGEIFALIVSNKAIETDKLQQLKAENDLDRIILGDCASCKQPMEREIAPEKFNSDKIISETSSQLSQAQPIVSIVATDNNAEESDREENFNLATFTIARTGETTEDLTVNYNISGKATNGQYYNQISDSIIIPAGKQKVAIPISPIDDDAIEEAENVSLTIKSNSEYTLDRHKFDSIASVDNDSLPYIKVTKPNAEETWEAGNPHSIAWKDNIDENVKIDLYKRDKFDRTLLKSTPSDGVEAVTLPAVLPSSDDYSIKVGSFKHHQINDLSDGNFALDPEIYIQIAKDDASSDLIWQDNIQGDLKVDLYKDNKFVNTLLTPDPYRDNQIISLKDLEPILSELSKDADYSLKVTLVNPDGSTTLVVDTPIQNRT